MFCCCLCELWFGFVFRVSMPTTKITVLTDLSTDPYVRNRVNPNSGHYATRMPFPLVALGKGLVNVSGWAFDNRRRWKHANSKTRDHLKIVRLIRSHLTVGSRNNKKRRTTYGATCHNLVPSELATGIIKGSETRLTRYQPPNICRPGNEQQTKEVIA